MAIGNHNRLTPCKAIKQYCHIACDGKMCENQECPLHPFRDGHNARRRGIGRCMPHAEKAQNGKYKPSQDGEKQITIRGYSKQGKLRIVLPSGDVLIVEEKSCNTLIVEDIK